MISVAGSRVARQNGALHWERGRAPCPDGGRGLATWRPRTTAAPILQRGGKGERVLHGPSEGGMGFWSAPLRRSRQPSLLWETSCRGNRPRLFFSGNAAFVGGTPLLTPNVQIDTPFACRVPPHGPVHGGRTIPFGLQGVARAGCRWGNARIGDVAIPQPGIAIGGSGDGGVGRRRRYGGRIPRRMDPCRAVGENR